MRSTPTQRGLLWCTLTAALAIAIPTFADQPDADPAPAPAPVTRPDAPAGDDLAAARTRLDIRPIAADDQIRERLQSVLDATGWFTEPSVRVEESVVFLSGGAETEELRRWAGDLARNTEGVAAVANRMEVAEPSPWDFGAAGSGISRLYRDFVASTPFIVLGIIILFFSGVAGFLVSRGLRIFLAKRIRARLLRGLVSRAAGVAVFLIGAYVVLRVAGLTQLALTIVGGTGLIGLAVGIAFRDITENYLASIFLSIQRPFETGDLIQIVAITGFVQQLNVRTTVLMSLDGNIVQIPNSAVYKNNIINYTANPARQDSFTVGIGYDDSIEQAQEIARTVLAEHPAVQDDPEPWVLVDSLGASTVNLKIYFWFDGHKHNILKVRSAIIRLVKHAYQKNGISMPDEAREIIFPAGVPVALTDERDTRAASPSRPAPQPAQPTRPAAAPIGTPQPDIEPVATPAEAGLSSDAATLERQARQVKPLDHAENLLQPARDPAPGKD